MKVDLKDLVLKYRKIQKLLNKRIKMINVARLRYSFDRERRLEEEIRVLNNELNDLEDFLLKGLRINKKVNNTISMKVGNHRIVASITLKDLKIKKVK